MISAFDAAYAAYADFQHGIERYWTLQWLAQHGITELDATVMKEGLVRAETLPLVFRALGCEALPRGTLVRVRITGSDALTLELHASLLARLDGAPPTTAEDDEEAEGSAGAASLALAIDVDESADAAETAPSSN